MRVCGFVLLNAWVLMFWLWLVAVSCLGWVSCVVECGLLGFVYCVVFAIVVFELGFALW